MARPNLTEPRDATLHTVHLAVLEGNEAIVNGTTVSNNREPRNVSLTCP